MKIKNLTVKPIGFGSVVILPDQEGDTPRGYGLEHPTVKYYLSRKWIEEVGDANKAPDDGEPDPDTADDAADSTGEKSDGVSGPKSLERMHKEDLQALASELGLAALETDTKQILIDRIKAARQLGE